MTVPERDVARREGGAERAALGLCGRCYNRHRRGVPPVHPESDDRGYVFADPLQTAYTKAGLDAYIARRRQRLRRKADAAA